MISPDVTVSATGLMVVVVVEENSFTGSHLHALALVMAPVHCSF